MIFKTPYDDNHCLAVWTSTNVKMMKNVVKIVSVTIKMALTRVGVTKE